MPWRDRPLVGLDTETTGPEPTTARLVTCCVGLTAGGRWAPRNWMLTQAEPIPAEATKVHGITTDEANRKGLPPEVALRQIRDDLMKAWGMGMVVCAFNAAFDITVLDRELRRHGLDGLTVRGDVLDPFLLDLIVDPYRRGSRKLIDVCAHYNVPLDEHDAHGAGPDALAATRLAWKIAGHPSLEHEAPATLMELQAAKYRSRQEAFDARAAGEGRPPSGRSHVWPLAPVTDDEADEHGYRRDREHVADEVRHLIGTDTPDGIARRLGWNSWSSAYRYLLRHPSTVELANRLEREHRKQHGAAA